MNKKEIKMKQLIQGFIDFRNHVHRPPKICKECEEFIKKYNWCPFLEYSWTERENGYYCKSGK